MLDTKALIGQLLNQQRSPATAKAGSNDLMAQAESLLGGGRIPGGAVTAGLAAMLLGTKGGRKVGKSVIKWGGLALLGGLAYKAYANWQAGNAPGAPNGTQPEHPPAHSPFARLADPAVQEDNSRLMVRAMIAAARADGRIDAEETKRLETALARADLGEEGRGFLIEALGQADDLDAIAAQADSPELAAEAWLAARLAIEPDTPQEKAFLARFATTLKLEPELVGHLEATAAAAHD